MSTTLPESARALSEDEVELVDLARRTIDATTDAGPDHDGVHTMGAAVRAGDGRMFAERCGHRAADTKTALNPVVHRVLSIFLKIFGALSHPVEHVDPCHGHLEGAEALT